MVLHQSPANEARRSRGELPINSVWFWGGGALPERIAAEDKILYTDDRYSQGLAKAVGVECLPLSAATEESLSDTRHAHKIILDTSLLAHDSTLDSRRALGERWQASVHQCQSRMAEIAAEFEGLTGCRLNLPPKAVNSRSPFARLKNVFRR